MSETPYEVFPLQPRSQQIRLLRVHPAESLEAALVCDLRMVSLEDKPDYCAMSYT